MKVTRAKRVWSLVLTICLILTMVPAFVSHVEVEAEAVSGISSLTCSGFISNTEHRNYIDGMMKYYLNTYSKLQTALNNGKSVIFMFEGGSDNYPSNAYADNTYDVRTQAVVIVVQMNSSGNAQIVFYSENCSSIPDDPDNCTGAAYSGATTLMDGIYGVQTTNHTGPYGALNTYASTGYYTPPGDQDGFTNGASGINIHTRTSASSGGGWSLGCQVIGYGNSSANEFNAFMKAVAGISYNVWVTYKSALYTLSGSNLYKDVGYYVLDRQLGLENANGEHYGSGSLIEMYNSTALTNITAWSTAAREAAGVDDYAGSQCTFYPSHCQIEVTLDGAPVNSQPCSVGTGGSETLLTASIGSTYTATGLFKNSYGNYWYRVTTSDGKTGYIYGGEAKYLKDLTTDITIKDYDTPNGHVSGNIFIVSGNITSKYNQIKNVAVWVHSGFGTTGSKVTGYSDSVNGYAYSLANSTIDYNTAFNAVPTGKHTYAISVDYINYYADGATTLKSNSGTKQLVEEYFVVVSSGVDQSSCSHSYSTTTIKAATCTEAGVAAKSCSKCGLVTETTVSALGHSYGAWTTVAATCTEDGSRSRICATCGDVQTETIAATGHDYDLLKHDASCTEYEIFEYTCSKCGDNYKLNAGELTTTWIDDIPEGMDVSLFRTKTQYRYADCTSTSWVDGGSKTVNYVNSWPTGFKTSDSMYAKYNNLASKVTASETDTTKIVVDSDKLVGYVWYHWCSASVTSSWAYETETYTTFHVYYGTTAPSNYACDTSDYSYKTSHSSCSNTNWWFPIEVYAQKYTTYEKEFDGKQWGEWSDWSDTAYTEVENTRKVETRTVYQLMSAAKGDHSWNGGVITTTPTCNSAGVKTYTCTDCGTTKTEALSQSGHQYNAVVTAPTCTTQGYTTYTCSNCGDSYKDHYVKANGHSYSAVVTNPTCTAQGYTTYTCGTCGDSYEANYVSASGHKWVEGACATCGQVCEHNYSNGSCTVCGQAEPVKDYYLFGYINGSNYACEEDFANLGQYKFENGKLVVTFSSPSYVAVKSQNNSDWYMTKGYLGESATTATLYNTKTGFANADKLYVPGGVEVTFTLVVNEDDTLTLSYQTAARQQPSFSVLSKTLNLEGEVKYNMIFMANNTSSVKNMGLITFLSNPSDVSIENADYVIPGAVSASGMYMVGSQGIPAKNLGDTLYMVIYAKLTDGSYAYSGVVPYSAKDYAYAQLGNSGITENQRKLLVAMLNYGAEAQLAFGYNTDNLINADLAAMEIPEMVTYSNDLLDACVTASSSKTGNFPAGGFRMNSATVSLEGALAINYLLMPANTPSNGMKVYYWTADTYNSASKLTIDNADGTLDSIVSSGMYMATYNGLAASQMGDTVYVAAVYENGGNTYTTGVISYSLAKYLTATADGTGEQKNLAAATVIYGYYANIEFPNV